MTRAPSDLRHLNRRVLLNHYRQPIPRRQTKHSEWRGQLIFLVARDDGHRKPFHGPDLTANRLGYGGHMFLPDYFRSRETPFVT